MKRFKKIYVEITNCCNLCCSFCGNTHRKKKEMTKEEFTIVVEKIKNYTDYIYLHVKGEPLMHHQLDEILSICDQAHLMVNITTNGTLLWEKRELLKHHPCIRQINVSLHCEQEKEDYFNQVFSVCKEMASSIYISYRIWTLKEDQLDKKSTEIVQKIIDSYCLSPEIVSKLYTEKQIQIDFHTYVNKENEFIWPSLNQSLQEEGYCHALSSQIAILVDGTIVPCCLDGEGEIPLGNIFSDSMEEVIKSKKFCTMLKGFQENKSKEKLCKQCNFKNRFLHSK